MAIKTGLSGRKMNPPFPAITTERLRLRQIKPSDADALFTIHSDVEWMRWYGVDPVTRHFQARQLAEMFVSWFPAGTGFRWGLELKHDQRLIGTGARPVVPEWAEGAGRPHVSVAHTLVDAAQLEVMAGGCEHKDVVVVGGGYVGVEMAEAFLARGAHVTIVTRSAHLLSNLDPEISERVEQQAVRDGIDLQLGRAIERMTDTAVVTATGEEINADMVVLALGVQPNTEFAAEAGLATGLADALVVDDHQRTSVDGVFAAGDCCEVFHRVSRRPAWIPLGTTANKASRVAGINLAGGDAAFGGVLGTAITRLVDTEISRTGLSLAQATEAGFDPMATTIETTTRSSYFPGASPMVIRLLHDRGSGQVLGAQIVGGAGAAKCIDTVAAALWGGLGLDELIDLDLAYAPPFSSVWDPVNVVARAAR